jgi:hypothetical protein
MNEAQREQEVLKLRIYLSVTDRPTKQIKWITLKQLDKLITLKDEQRN